MSIDISAAVTAIWPVTETTLLADATADPSAGVAYATQKTAQIERAKRTLYEDRTIPADEADIPDLAAYWITDQAVVFKNQVVLDVLVPARRA